MSLAFLTFAVLSILLPGPDTLVALRYAAVSRRAGLKAVAGVCAGLTTHTCVAAVGVSTVLTALPQVQNLLKLVGGLFLVYLGVSMLRSDERSGSDSGRPIGPRPARYESTIAAAARQTRRQPRKDSQHYQLATPFLVGFAVNMTNAKTWLAFSTVVPAMLSADGEPVAAGSMLQGGFVLTALAGGWYCALASLINGRRATARTTSRLISVLCGGVLAGFGFASALAALTAWT